MLPQAPKRLTSAFLLTALFSKFAVAQSNYVVLQLYPSTMDCTGDSVQITFDYALGYGDTVNQLDFTYQSGFIVAGDEGCGISGCQYGSSCYNTAVMGFDTYCTTGGAGLNFDKVLINTC